CICLVAPFAGDIGISAQRASLLMSVFAFTMLFGKIGIGLLCDLWPPRVVCGLAMGMLAAATLLMLLSPGEPQLMLACALMGLSAGSCVSLSGALVGRFFGAAAFGSVLGLFWLCEAGFATVAPFGGWLRDRFGSYEPVWWLLLG